MATTKLLRREVVLYKTSQGKVNEVGVDQPDCTIISENDYFIAIKIPGQKYWVGIGMARGYASPETVVYEKVESSEPGSWKRLECTPAIGWEHSRPAKK